MLSAGASKQGGNETSNEQQPAAAAPQVLTIALTTIYECPPSPVKEVFSYSKGVQTSEDWLPAPRPRALSDSDAEEPTSTPSKRLSRRERDREEELRQQIRNELEQELKAAQELVGQGTLQPTALSTNFPVRTLTAEEIKAVTASDEFLDFVERSTKVIERALDQEYDILTDYTLQAHEIDEDEQGNVGGRGRRKVKEVRQFYDDRWSKKRMITSIDFSPKFPDLLLASYTKNPAAPHDPDGIVQVWSLNLHSRPEFVFHAQSDVLTAKFSPFHPNLIIGGAYSGQVLLWDTRAKSAPVQKTPLTGSGHTHTRLCRRHRGHAKREQHHQLQHRRRRLRLVGRHVRPAPGSPVSDGPAAGEDRRPLADVSSLPAGGPDLLPSRVGGGHHIPLPPV